MAWISSYLLHQLLSPHGSAKPSPFGASARPCGNRDSRFDWDSTPKALQSGQNTVYVFNPKRRLTFASRAGGGATAVLCGGSVTVRLNGRRREREVEGYSYVGQRANQQQAGGPLGEGVRRGEVWGGGSGPATGQRGSTGRVAVRSGGGLSLSGMGSPRGRPVWADWACSEWALSQRHPCSSIVL
jgi:hypothetical protein